MSTEDTTESTDEPAHPYETEDSFHPMGEEWEGRMREELEETDFDADLGMQMARDAQRLVAGEITEAEFYDEYHDDVEEEFETDARPVFDDIEDAEFEDVDDGSMLKNLADIDLEGDDASRRDVMKKMGAGAAFLGYGAYATVNQGGEDVPQDISGIRPAGPEEREHRWGMVIDLERCDGCLACVTGCVDENGTSTGANWMYVFTYDNEATEQENFLVRPCQHCSNAPCAKVCPVRARHARAEDGIVLTDYETCIGCRYCQVACPYGVNYFQWGEPDVPMDELTHLDKTPEEVRALDEEERNRQLTEANDHVYDDRGKWVDSRPPQGVMGKCTFCPTRQDGHSGEEKFATTACMDACDESGMSAIHFGDMDDPESRPNQYLRRRSENANEKENIKFDADLDFAVNAEEPIDVDDGHYPLAFVERRAGTDPWLAIDSGSAVVSSDQSFDPSENFEESRIDDIGGIPSEETDVLYTDEETDIDLRIVYDDDEFESEAESEDFNVALRLVGAGADDDIADRDVTLDVEDNLVDDQLVAETTLTVDGSTITRPDDIYVLYLLVEETVEGETARRVADTRRVYLSGDRPAVDTPDLPYSDSSLTGALDSVPPVLFTGDEQTVAATIQYPEFEQTHETRLVLLEDGSEDVVAAQEYTFDEQDTTNTPWGGKQSSFKLLENLGTEPNITYLGNEPAPDDEQREGPVAYGQLDSEKWDEWMNIIDERKEHLDYGAAANGRNREGAD